MIEALIIDYEKEIDIINDILKTDLPIEMRIRLEVKEKTISKFISRLKNLNGETVKREQGCESEHIKTVNRMFTCDGCGNVNCTCTPE